MLVLWVGLVLFGIRSIGGLMLMKLLVSIKDELFDQLGFSRSSVCMELVVCGVTIPGGFFFYLWPCCPLKVIILQLNAPCSAVATLLEVFVPSPAFLTQQGYWS